MNEKGFQMGQTKGNIIIYDKASGPLVVPSTGIFKWVLIIEYIAADGYFIKPYIIHIENKSENHWWTPTEQLSDWL